MTEYESELVKEILFEIQNKSERTLTRIEVIAQMLLRSYDRQNGRPAVDYGHHPPGLQAVPHTGSLDL